MKRTFILAVLFVFCMLGSVYALSVGGPGGAWPKDAPKELEPLRKQAWTWLHGRTVKDRGQYTSYEIPFANRDQFESAWPHILKFKGKATTVTLVRGNHIRVASRTAGYKRAGVRIVGLTNVRSDPQVHPKIKVTDIQLVVDGMIVDLNRIQLPAGTKIIDKRFPSK